METMRREVREEWRQKTQPSEQRASDTAATAVPQLSSNGTDTAPRDLSNLVRLHEIRQTRQMGKTVRLRSIRRMLHREIDYWLLQDQLARQVNFNLEAISVIKDLSATLDALKSSLSSQINEAAIERKKTNDQIHQIDGRIASLETEGSEQIARSWLNKIDVASLAYADPKAHDVFSERFVEYVWVLENLIEKGKILEVGCVESELPQILSEYPDVEVYGIDIRPYMNPLFKFFLEDARSTRFGNGTFDQVLCVSSIEHFGLLWYGEIQLDPEADVKAAREIYRILKPSATLILTAPFGTGQPNWYRTYNTSTLSKLLHGYEITRARFYTKLGSIWLPSSRAEAEKADCHESTHGLACIVARKPTDDSVETRRP